MPIPGGQLCKNCGTSLKRKSYTFCSNSCQATFQYRRFVGQWLTGKVDGGRIGGVSTHIRRYLIETSGERCSSCDWSIINPTFGKVPLEVHHIDGNHTHNAVGNLKLLCPNCHSLTPTYRGLNRGKGRATRNARLLSTTVSTVVL